MIIIFLATLEFGYILFQLYLGFKRSINTILILITQNNIRIAGSSIEKLLCINHYIYADNLIKIQGIKMYIFTSLHVIYFVTREDWLTYGLGVCFCGVQRAVMYPRPLCCHSCGKTRANR